MKNKTKRSLSKAVSFLTLISLMLGLLMPLTYVNTSAAAPTYYTTISADSSATVNITSAGGAKYFKFVPTYSGAYRFYSNDGSTDPKASLLNSSGTVLLTDDDGGAGNNFSIEYNCTANTAYYIKAFMYSSSSTGSYVLNVETVSTTGTTPTTPTGSVVDVTASGSYSLFNSGATSSSGRYYSSASGGDYNPDSRSYSNNGYDIYGDSPISFALKIGMGISFTVSQPITERAVLTVYAYDIDEESGQIDYVYLVDETSGTRTRIGHLSGMDNQWNTTTLYIDASCFTVGHSYRFENEVCAGGWWTWIRTVSIRMTTAEAEEDLITDHSFTASINGSGTVTTNLYLKTTQSATYTLEYTATISGNQKGSAQGQTVTATQSGVNKQVSFALESGSPAGTYQIDVILKDAQGNTKQIYSCNAGYKDKAVSYDSNGGSNQIPIDSRSYSPGDTVTVLFDYLPSRAGYNFLGWSTSSSATAPDYTENGTKTFNIGSSDVTLYAVWAPAAHVWTESSRTEPTCTEYGTVVYTCICGASYNELIRPTGHNYQITNTVAPTCTVDGYIDFECTNDCDSTKHQVIAMLGHDFGDDDICDKCGYVRVVHDHVYTINTVDPTCTSMGYTEYICSCGYSYRDNYIEPIRHNWNGGVITIAKSCIADGLKTYTCLNCSAAKTEILPAGHEWSETVTLDKTCTSDGSKTKTCMVCGTVEIEVIPAGHNWDEGVINVAATCTSEGSKTCTCLDCGVTESFVVAVLGHNFVNGICTRCGIRFIEIVTPSEHPLYGMYFEIDDILSDYGPDLVDEYGVMLDYNSGANLEKVAVYLTQDGTMWRRCIAVKGDGITYATYVPYLSYQSDIKYTGLNHDWINVFSLSENSDGIWCYSDYATIGVNLEDAYGNLLLSLYDIGQAGAETKIFDDLDEMIAWLKGECAVHTPGDWIIDVPATSTSTGTKHKECIVCGRVLETALIPALAKLVIADVEAKAGSTVSVSVDVRNNPGIIGALLTFEFDPALTLVGAEAGGAWKSLNFTRPSELTNNCNFIWDGVTNADYSNGTIIVLTFKVPDGADVNTVYNISASYTSKNMINADLEPMDIEIENGSITVKNPVGDANGDGVVDVADVIVLRRYLAGNSNTLVDVNAADMDNDGYITVADIVLLRRFLVG